MRVNKAKQSLLSLMQKEIARLALNEHDDVASDLQFNVVTLAK